VLTIRRAQMAALERTSLETWLVSHVRTHFPQLCETLSGPELADFVAEGIDRARAYGFTETKHLAQWLNLMALLGPQFDQDPGCPFVAPILAGTEPGSIKMLDLLDAAEEHVWGGDES